MNNELKELITPIIEPLKKALERGFWRGGSRRDYGLDLFEIRARLDDIQKSIFNGLGLIALSIIISVIIFSIVYYKVNKKK